MGDCLAGEEVGKLVFECRGCSAVVCSLESFGLGIGKGGEMRPHLTKSQL